MERTDFNKNTFSFSIAIFNCVVNAVLVFFFPISTASSWWIKVIVCFLMLFSLPALLYKDELKQERRNNPDFPRSKKLVYYTIYITEGIFLIVFMMLILSPFLHQQSVEGTLAENWNDANAWQSLGDTCIYILLALIPFSAGFLCNLAGQQGKKCGITYIYTIVVLVLVMVVYYLEFRESGIQIPSYVQSICFLLNIPYLFRLRQLENYSHLTS